MKERNRPVALVLGGTNPHVALVNKLKARGYHTILVDYFPNSPAKRVADEHIRESTMDQEAVLKIAKDYNASLVITTNIDQANITACYVAEKLGLPHPYSYETALNVTDKSRMKKIMWDNGIPTAPYKEVTCVRDALHAGIPYPIIMKPVDSNGSKGVYKCTCDEDVEAHFMESKAVSRTGKVIVERFVDGTEVSYYYFVQDGKAQFITSCQKFPFKKGTKGVVQRAGGLFPAPMPDDVNEKMRRAADRIAEAFQLNNTPMFIQAMVENLSDVFVLEFAPRLGGGLSFRIIENENQFDFIDAAIDSFLGVHTQLDIVHPEYYSAVMVVYASAAVMGDITGIDAVLEDKSALEFHQYAMKGSTLSGDMSSRSRVGAFYIQGSDANDIYRKIEHINQCIEVFDSDGNKIMNHDIYDFS